MGLALGTNLEILHQSVKRVQTKIQKVLGANSYVCKNWGETGRRDFCAPPLFLNRVKLTVKQAIENIWKSDQTNAYIRALSKQKDPLYKYIFWQFFAVILLGFFASNPSI